MPHSSTLNYYWKKKTILSFLAIFFVIVIHNSAINQYTNLPPDTITDFTTSLHYFFAYNLGAAAVPLFFFISGLTFFRNYTPDKYPSKLKTRFHTLVIPYLIWNIIGLLFAILYTYTPLSTIISDREAFAPTLSNILSGIFLYKYNFHFWFLFDLIIFVVLTPLFNLLVSKKWLAPIIIIILLALPLFNDSFLHIRLNFIIYYYLGAFLGKHYLHKFTKPASLRASLLAGIIIIIILTFNTLANINHLVIPAIISELLLITLVFSLWFFSDLIIKHLTLHKFYSTFFPIYIIHPYLIATIIKLVYLLLPQTSWILLLNDISSPILTITISIPLILAWHRYLPKSYNLLFGVSASK